MKKNKKAKLAGKTPLFGGTKSLKKPGKSTSRRLDGLSTLQKVAGGAAIVALGLSFLAKRKGAFPGPGPTTPAAARPETNPAEPNQAAPDTAAASEG